VFPSFQSVSLYMLPGEKHLYLSFMKNIEAQSFINQEKYLYEVYLPRMSCNISVAKYIKG